MKRIFRQWLSGLLSVVLAFTLLPATARAADFPSSLNGTGDAGDPYQISTEEQLRQLSDYVNAKNTCENMYFKLMQDIDLTNRWRPIGVGSSDGFSGTFDGGGHTVRGLDIWENREDAGLFGNVNSKGVVKNLAVAGVVCGSSYSAGIVSNNAGTVENCHNLCNIEANAGTGNISYCGGIVGYNEGTVKNCYNTGNISYGGQHGGIVGINRGSVLNCYNTGNIDGSSSGGIVGSCASGTVTNCFYLDGTAETGVGSGDGAGAVEKTAAEFRNLASALNSGSNAWENDLLLGRPVLNDNKETYTATKDHPFEIPDKTALENFRNYVNAGNDCTDMYFKVTNNIDLEGDTDDPWTPIGDGEADNSRFKGTFDGDNHTISGLYINDRFLPHKGLFARLYSATVKNLTVSGSITGQTKTGGIAGLSELSTIENCVNECTITGGYGTVGGIVGEFNGGTIKGCINKGPVTAPADSCGGIAGNVNSVPSMHSEGTVIDCYNTGDVNSSMGPAGGIAGKSWGKVSNCYNTGSISCPDASQLGGIAGSVYGTIENCYYLETSCDVAGGGIAKSEDVFKSGEVAYLLQNGQETQDPLTWGQTVADGGYPELTQDGAKKVYQITGMVEEQAIVWYSNSSASLPDAPSKEGYTFAGWSTKESGPVDFDVNTEIDDDTTVYAIFKEIYIPPAPSTTVDTPVTDTGSGETTVTVNTRSTTNGTTARASVSNGYMSRAVDSAVNEATRQGTAPVVEVDVRTSSWADSLNVTLPAGPLEKLAEAEDSSLVIVSDIADVALDNTALSALAAQATGNTVILEVKPVAPSELSEAQAETVDEAPVEDVSVVSNGVAIHDYHGGRVTVTLPYKLAEGQSADDVVVYYLDDAGTLTPCDTSYDSKAEEVTFVTVHLSRYVIGDTALGEEKDCPSEKFTDLDAGAWYHDYTDYVITHGLMKGIGGSLFAPDGTVTRAQTVTALWNMRGRPVVNYYMTYADVTEDAWYAEAVRWAASEGIASGYGGGLFGPGDPITREQMAAMMYRYEQKYGDGGFTGDWMYRLPFTDLDQISDWAFESVAWCNMKGVIKGKGNSVFDPKGLAKRSEMAAILTRYCGEKTGEE